MKANNGNNLLEEDKYTIIRPYNVDKKYLFNTDRFDVKVVSEGRDKLVIMREKSVKKEETNILNENTDIEDVKES